MAIPISVSFDNALTRRLKVRCFNSHSVSIRMAISYGGCVTGSVGTSSVATSLRADAMASTNCRSIPVLIDTTSKTRFAVSGFCPASTRNCCSIIRRTDFPLRLGFAGASFTTDNCITNAAALDRSSTIIGNPGTCITRVSGIITSVELSDSLARSRVISLGPITISTSNGAISCVSLGGGVATGIPVLGIRALDPRIGLMGTPMGTRGLFAVACSADDIRTNILRSTNVGTLGLNSVSFSGVGSGGGRFAFSVAGLGNVVILSNASGVAIGLATTSSLRAESVVISRKSMAIDAPRNFGTHPISITPGGVAIINAGRTLSSVATTGVIVSYSLGSRGLGINATSCDLSISMGSTPGI